MVDEAHATGALGPGGRGSVAAAGLTGEVDVVVGTLGKALGSYGAYVCAERARSSTTCVNAARPFVFSTAPPAAGRRRGRRRRWSCSKRQPGPGRASCGRTRRPCARRSPRRAWPAAASGTQIVPVAIGDAERDDGALRAAARARRLRPGHPPADRARRGPRGCASPVMATHRRGELRRGRELIGAAAPRARASPPPAPRRAAGCATRRLRSTACAASSSPAPAPRSARPSSPRSSPARLAASGRAGRRLQARRHRPRRAAVRPTTSCCGAPPGSTQADDEIAPYRYGPPASPHLAAALAGEEIEPERLLEAAQRRRGRRRRARLRGRRRPARPAGARLPRPRPRRGPGAAAGRSPPRPASARSTTRC